MKHSKLLILFLLSLVTVWSCDSLLDYEPQQSVSSDVALTTSENVELVLVGAYDALQDGDAYGGYIMLMPDLLSDAGYIDWDGTYTELTDMWLKQQRVDNVFVDDVWIAFYNVINISNNVLSALDVVDEDIKGRIKGEAQFLRGISYFELAHLYGKSWNDGDPSTNLGVPLVLLPDSKLNETKDLPRATVSEVYAQIITDLTDARNLLPPTNGIFATKYAAAAMLSRVYLQQGKYAEAAEAANFVIESGNYILTEDYKDAFNSAGGISTETVFALRISDQDGNNSLFTHYASSVVYGARGDATLTSKFTNLFEAGDERLTINYTDQEGLRTGKFINQYANIAVIRLAEMYLNRAESNFRLGAGNYVGPNTPAQDLNIIRGRVELSAIATPTLQDILDERFLELAFEGQHLYDVKRLELSIGSIAWNDPILVFPIPLREINANNNLDQNDGYIN